MTDTHESLERGRGPDRKVVVLAGALGGEGKSLLLKPLERVFSGDGLVFGTPGKTNFPLLGLETAKVAFLDEWRLDPTVMSCSAQCT